VSNLETDADLHKHVKHALRHYHDRATLGYCPLAAWRSVRQRLPAALCSLAPLALGQAVQELLAEVIEALKPNSPPSFTTRQWRPYHLLDLTFRQNESPQQVYEARLHISRSHYYRELDRAIASATDLLREWEWAARAQTSERQEEDPEPGRGTAKLPPPTYTRLFGAETPLAALIEALCDHNGRWLLVVEGLGGVGKTALAREAARQALELGGFADLAWETAQRRAFGWGEIQLCAEPTLTVERLLDSLALQIGLSHLVPLPTEEKRRALRSACRQAPYLLVIDNLETAKDYRTIVEELWGLANPTKVLITSRHHLERYEAATCLQLRSLNQQAAGDFIRYHAVERGAVRVRNADDQAIARITRTTGGNPLAIKLVIGQAACRPLDQVLDYLEQARGDTEQLYRYIYQAAWDLLTSPARQVLLGMPHLSLQGGPWQAVAAISGLAEEALIQAVKELASLSLLDVSREAAPRYSIHPLTRSFVLSDLVEKEQNHR
jgi:hypothetical protein